MYLYNIILRIFMNISDKLENIKSDIYQNGSKNDCKKFFLSSLLHFTISLEVSVGHFKEEYISYEKICENIPKRFGSRSTIQTILNESVHNKFFIKEISKNDKRVKIYKLSNDFSKMVNQWVDFHQNIINKNQAA